MSKEADYPVRKRKKTAKIDDSFSENSTDEDDQEEEDYVANSASPNTPAIIHFNTRRNSNMSNNTISTFWLLYLSLSLRLLVFRVFGEVGCK